jgi:UDP-sugar pyrophosphorylase
LFSQAGVEVDNPVLQKFNQQEVEVWPRIIWKPKWAVTFTGVKSKVSGKNSITQRSTLAIKGRNIFLEDLSLEGAFILDAIDDAEVGFDLKLQKWMRK